MQKKVHHLTSSGKEKERKQSDSSSDESSVQPIASGSVTSRSNFASGHGQIHKSTYYHGSGQSELSPKGRPIYYIGQLHGDLIFGNKNKAQDHAKIGQAAHYSSNAASTSNSAKLPASTEQLNQLASVASNNNQREDKHPILSIDTPVVSFPHSPAVVVSQKKADNNSNVTPGGPNNESIIGRSPLDGTATTSSSVPKNLECEDILVAGRQGIASCQKVLLEDDLTADEACCSRSELLATRKKIENASINVLKNHDEQGAILKKIDNLLIGVTKKEKQLRAKEIQGKNNLYVNRLTIDVDIYFKNIDGGIFFVYGPVGSGKSWWVRYGYLQRYLKNHDISRVELINFQHSVGEIFENYLGLVEEILKSNKLERLVCDNVADVNLFVSRMALIKSNVGIIVTTNFRVKSPHKASIFCGFEVMIKEGAQQSKEKQMECFLNHLGVATLPLEQQPRIISDKLVSSPMIIKDLAEICRANPNVSSSMIQDQLFDSVNDLDSYIGRLYQLIKFLIAEKGFDLLSLLMFYYFNFMDLDNNLLDLIFPKKFRLMAYDHGLLRKVADHFQIDNDVQLALRVVIENGSIFNSFSMPVHPFEQVLIHCDSFLKMHFNLDVLVENFSRSGSMDKCDDIEEQIKHIILGNELEVQKYLLSGVDGQGRQDRLRKILPLLWVAAYIFSSKNNALDAKKLVDFAFQSAYIVKNPSKSALDAKALVDFVFESAHVAWDPPNSAIVELVESFQILKVHIGIASYRNPDSPHRELGLVSAIANKYLKSTSYSQLLIKTAALLLKGYFVLNQKDESLSCVRLAESALKDFQSITKNERVKKINIFLGFLYALEVRVHVAADVPEDARAAYGRANALLRIKFSNVHSALYLRLEYSWASYQLQLGDVKTAKMIFEEQLGDFKEKYDHPRKYRFYYELLQGRLLFESGDYIESQKIFMALYQLKNHYELSKAWGELLIYLARVATVLREYDLAKNYFNAAVDYWDGGPASRRSSRDYGSFLYYYSIYLISCGDYDQAKEKLMEGVNIFYRRPKYNKRKYGNISLMNINILEELINAQKFFQETEDIIALSCYRELSRIFSSLGFFEDARTLLGIYCSAIKKFSGNNDLEASLGDACYLDLADSLVPQEKINSVCQKFSGGGRWAEKAIVLYSLTHHYYKFGQYQQAIALAEDFLAQCPKVFVNLIRAFKIIRARILFDLGISDEAKIVLNNHPQGAWLPFVERVFIFYLQLYLDSDSQKNKIEFLETHSKNLFNELGAHPRSMDFLRATYCKMLVHFYAAESEYSFKIFSQESDFSKVIQLYDIAISDIITLKNMSQEMSSALVRLNSGDSSCIVSDRFFSAWFVFGVEIVGFFCLLRFHEIGQVVDQLPFDNNLLSRMNFIENLLTKYPFLVLDFSASLPLVQPKFNDHELQEKYINLLIKVVSGVEPLSFKDKNYGVLKLRITYICLLFESRHYCKGRILANDKRLALTKEVHDFLNDSDGHLAYQEGSCILIFFRAIRCVIFLLEDKNEDFLVEMDVFFDEYEKLKQNGFNLFDIQSLFNELVESRRLLRERFGSMLETASQQSDISGPTSSDGEFLVDVEKKFASGDGKFGREEVSIEDHVFFDSIVRVDSLNENEVVERVLRCCRPDSLGPVIDYFSFAKTYFEKISLKITNYSSCILSGESGVGKSHLIKIFCSALPKDDSVVFWLNMNDEVTFFSSLNSLFGVDLSRGELIDAFDKLIYRLKNDEKQNIFIVFDGVVSDWFVGVLQPFQQKLKACKLLISLQCDSEHRSKIVNFFGKNTEDIDILVGGVLDISEAIAQSNFVGLDFSEKTRMVDRLKKIECSPVLFLLLRNILKESQEKSKYLKIFFELSALTSYCQVVFGRLVSEIYYKELSELERGVFRSLFFLKSRLFSKEHFLFFEETFGCSPEQVQEIIFKLTKLNFLQDVSFKNNKGGDIDPVYEVHEAIYSEIKKYPLPEAVPVNCLKMLCSSYKKIEEFDYLNPDVFNVASKSTWTFIHDLLRFVRKVFGKEKARRKDFFIFAKVAIKLSEYYFFHIRHVQLLLDFLDEKNPELLDWSLCTFPAQKLHLDIYLECSKIQVGVYNAGSLDLLEKILKRVNSMLTSQQRMSESVEELEESHVSASLNKLPMFKVMVTIFISKLLRATQLNFSGTSLVIDDLVEKSGGAASFSMLVGNDLQVMLIFCESIFAIISEKRFVNQYFNSFQIDDNFLSELSLKISNFSQEIFGRKKTQESSEKQEDVHFLGVGAFLSWLSSIQYKNGDLIKHYTVIQASILRYALELLQFEKSSFLDSVKALLSFEYKKGACSKDASTIFDVNKQRWLRVQAYVCWLSHRPGMALEYLNEAIDNIKKFKVVEFDVEGLIDAYLLRAKVRWECFCHDKEAINDLEEAMILVKKHCDLQRERVSLLLCDIYHKKLSILLSRPGGVKNVEYDNVQRLFLNAAPLVPAGAKKYIMGYCKTYSYFGDIANHGLAVKLFGVLNFYDELAIIKRDGSSRFNYQLVLGDLNNMLFNCYGKHIDECLCSSWQGNEPVLIRKFVFYLIYFYASFSAFQGEYKEAVKLYVCLLNLCSAFLQGNDEDFFILCRGFLNMRLGCLKLINGSLDDVFFHFSEAMKIMTNFYRDGDVLIPHPWFADSLLCIAQFLKNQNIDFEAGDFLSVAWNLSSSSDDKNLQRINKMAVSWGLPTFSGFSLVDIQYFDSLVSKLSKPLLEVSVPLAREEGDKPGVNGLDFSMEDDLDQDGGKDDLSDKAEELVSERPTSTQEAVLAEMLDDSIENPGKSVSEGATVTQKVVAEMPKEQWIFSRWSRMLSNFFSAGTRCSNTIEETPLNKSPVVTSDSDASEKESDSEQEDIWSMLRL